MLSRMTLYHGTSKIRLSLWPELQLEDNRLSHPFGYALVVSLFMDEINLYTSLTSYIGLLFICNSCFMLG